MWGGGGVNSNVCVHESYWMRISCVYLVPMDHAPTRQSLVHING